MRTESVGTRVQEWEVTNMDVRHEEGGEEVLPSIRNVEEVSDDTLFQVWWFL